MSLGKALYESICVAMVRIGMQMLPWEKLPANVRLAYEQAAVAFANSFVVKEQ